MATKSISSTSAQNNFGRILDDVIQNSSRYIIMRRNASQAILLSLADFENLLTGTEIERREVSHIVRELAPIYDLGKTIEE
jgi:PHD/YefM family antitoxin component YafN of YafNO toxin-antitoxin module